MHRNFVNANINTSLLVDIKCFLLNQIDFQTPKFKIYFTFYPLIYVPIHYLYIVKHLLHLYGSQFICQSIYYYKQVVRYIVFINCILCIIHVNYIIFKIQTKNTRNNYVFHVFYNIFINPQYLTQRDVINLAPRLFYQRRHCISMAASC